MKLRYLILSVACLAPAARAAHAKTKKTQLLRQYIAKSTQPARAMASVVDAVDIGYSFIENISFPLVISTPGAYVFLEDIFFDGSTASSAITINPNVGEVVIDFANFSLNQTVAATGVTGIAIGTGNNRVTIRGGGISEFSQSAIAVADGCSEIYLDGMSFVNCGNRGVEFNGSSGISQSAIINCVFTQNCTTQPADNVLTLSNCSDVVVANCLLNNNGFLGGTITGTLTLVKTFGCKRCHFDNVSCTDASGNTDVRGFSLNSTSNSHFQNCIVDLLHSSSTCAGFQLEASSGNASNKFINCKASNFNGAFTLDGFFAATNSNDNLFENCDSASHASTNTFGTAHGFRSVSNSRNQFKNCRAHGSTAANNASTGAHGFKLDTCTDVSLQACRASNHSSGGAAVGFLVKNCTSASVFNCVASSNGLGFDHVGTFNNQAFVQNVALKNTTAYSAAFPATAHDNTSASTPSLLTNPWNNIAIS